MRASAVATANASVATPERAATLSRAGMVDPPRGFAVKRIQSRVEINIALSRCDAFDACVPGSGAVRCTNNAAALSCEPCRLAPCTAGPVLAILTAGLEGNGDGMAVESERT